MPSISGGDSRQANTPVVPIGIGPEYNADLMKELADTSRGRPYHLQNMQELQEILETEVDRRFGDVFTDLQVRFATVKGVAVNSVTGLPWLV